MNLVKIKIIKIFPYWLLALVLLISAQTAASLIFTKKISNLNLSVQSPQPEVLGASTQSVGLRGSQPAYVPIAQLKSPDISNVKAKSFLVFDLASGQNLMEQNADQKLGIASLTKLMTALVAYKNSDLNGTFTVSNKDVLNIRPVLGFSLGDRIKILDIFNSMLIGSCNDAALALADYVSQLTGKNFVGLMNEQAKILGMSNTSYQNPIGFDSQTNYSTANDLKILISEVQNLATFKDLGRRTDYQFYSESNKLFRTTATNKLVKNHPDISAIKTGFTGESGGAMATKVNFFGHEVVILVLDSQNREADTLNLKNELSQDFKWN